MVMVSSAKDCPSFPVSILTTGHNTLETSLTRTCDGRSARFLNQTAQVRSQSASHCLLLSELSLSYVIGIIQGSLVGKGGRKEPEAASRSCPAGFSLAYKCCGIPRAGASKEEINAMCFNTGLVWRRAQTKRPPVHCSPVRPALLPLQPTGGAMSLTGHFGGRGFSLDAFPFRT